MPVVLIGTLDTKGVEIQFLREVLHQASVRTLVVDAGVLHLPLFSADVPRDQVFAAAGTTHAAVLKAGDRGKAVAAAALGVARVVQDLHAKGQVDGVLGIGGSAGTTIGTSAMRALPFGVPKLMVSTLASGQTRPYVGVRDLLMMNSVVNICGLNFVSRTVLTNAALAMAGMLRGKQSLQTAPELRPLVSATMFGVTTPCVEAARKRIEQDGFEVLVFHATGTGGQAMESFVADKMISGVLDITTTELADELVGGVLTAGPDRLTAAGLHGVPQVISLGALDMVNFGTPETVPEKFHGRHFYQHNPTVTLMRTTPEENDQLGKEIAQKASAAKDPTAVLVPLRGVSGIDKQGQPFWWPEADQALFQSLRNWMSPQVELMELDLHVNDPAFAETAANTLLRLLGRC